MIALKCYLIPFKTLRAKDIKFALNPSILVNILLFPACDHLQLTIEAVSAPYATTHPIILHPDRNEKAFALKTKFSAHFESETGNAHRLSLERLRTFVPPPQTHTRAHTLPAHSHHAFPPNVTNST